MIKKSAKLDQNSDFGHVRTCQGLPGAQVLVGKAVFSFFQKLRNTQGEIYGTYLRNIYIYMEFMRNIYIYIYMEYPLNIHCRSIAYNYIAYTLNMPQVIFNTYIDIAWNIYVEYTWNIH